MHVEESRVKFSIVHSSEDPFKSAWIRIVFKEEHKGEYLYLYPLKRVSDGIKMLPQDLILIGSLAIPLDEGEKECVYELKYLPLEKYGYCLVAAVGSKAHIK